MREWERWPIKVRMRDQLPVGLRKSNGCPDKFYYRGRWDNSLFEKCVAVVGSRKMSSRGKAITGELVMEIVRQGGTVVSGFMYGIDSEAHRSCLEMGGKTVAVLGTGLDVLTPTKNDWLYNQILINEGIILSEYRPDFVATKWSFARRNRWVVALATDGVLVVEAGVKSGSMLTANLALRQKKTVMVPESSKGVPGIDWLIENKEVVVLKKPEDIFS